MLKQIIKNKPIIKITNLYNKKNNYSTNNPKKPDDNKLLIIYISCISCWVLYRNK